MDNVLYEKRDLEDYASDQESVDSYGRVDNVKELLPDDAIVKNYSAGGYEGTIGIVIKLDGYYWLIKEMYGSCSLCDPYIASDDHAEYARSIMRNAYCLPDKESAEKFLKKKEEDDSYGWKKITTQMNELIQEI